MKRIEKNPCPHRAYNLAGGRERVGGKKGQNNQLCSMIESVKYYRQRVVKLISKGIIITDI